MNPFTLTREQVRKLDRRAIEEFGVPSAVLMENAGRGCAELLMQLNPERTPTVILCGPGNNGGDGFVIARHLDNHNWPVKVWLVLPEDPDRVFGFARAVAALDRRLAPDCELNCGIWEHANPVAINHPPGNAWKEALVADMTAAGWVVDALFGTGLSRPLGAPYQELFPFINGAKKPVLAVDLPSGMDCDTGEPLGPTIRATHTATFVAPKRGFLHPTAYEWTGEVHLLDIGAPRMLVEEYRNVANGDA